MDTDEINALRSDTFEQKLYDKWAISRRDLYVGMIAAPRALIASQPIRLPEVLTRLKITQAALVALLATSRLPRPGRMERGNVAWRRDEVEPLMPLNPWLSERDHR